MGLSAFRVTGAESPRDELHVEIVDQLVLPHEVRWEVVRNIAEAFDAIKSMKVRRPSALFR